VDLDEILYGGDDIEDGLDSILLKSRSQQFKNGGRLNF
jgi:hypothetical protein